MGRLARPLLLIVAGIVSLAILASAALFFFFDPNDFRDEISAQVKELTGRDLVIEGDLSLSVFPWIAVNVGRTRLGNAEGFGNKPFLSFEEARLSVRLMPLLFQKRVAIGTASLDSFSLNLEVAANGTNNWDDLAEAAEAEPVAETVETGGTKPLDIANFRLGNASISFLDAQAGAANTISGLTLKTSSITAAKPFDIDAEFDFSTEPVGVSGHLEFAGTMTLAEGNEQLSIRGFAIDGQLDGIVSETTDFRFAAPSIDVDMAAERVTMGEMELSLFGLDLSADVEPYSSANPQPKMTIAVQPFSLKALMQTLAVDTPATADPDALGRVSFSATAEVGQTAMTLTAMTLELDDTRLTGQLSLPLTERGAYQFDFAADSINLDRYMAPADATGGDASAATGDEIEIPVDLIRSLKANGSLKIARAYLSGMTFENVVVAIDSANSRLRMYPVSAELFGGTYNGDVRINAASDTPSISVNERISGVQLAPLALSMFEQDNITGTLDGHFKLSGSGRNLAAIRRDLRGTMAFSLADGIWEGTDVWYQLRSARAMFKQEAPPEPRLPARTEFTAVRATGTVIEGVFSNNDLLAELPFLQLTGNGTVDLAEGQVDYSMQARVMEQPEFIDATNEAELADFSAAVIPLRISGPLASPSIRPDIEAMLRAEMKRAVEKQGEALKKRLIDELIGGGERPASDQTVDENADQAEPEQEKDPEDQLEDALKKLLGH
jgi:AsmA protein